MFSRIVQKFEILSLEDLLYIWLWLSASLEVEWEAISASGSEWGVVCELGRCSQAEKQIVSHRHKSAVVRSNPLSNAIHLIFPVLILVRLGRLSLGVHVMCISRSSGIPVCPSCRNFFFLQAMRVENCYYPL